ncbi:MAG TPA: acyl-CoA thioesterase [Trebonia sp.]|nr:acyl-CoA thioesterase [Trebonia sp.]
MSDQFYVRFRVRGYEVDTQGHLNWAQYLHYAEQARWECMAAAGITQDALLASGVGPAALDVQLKFRRELRGGDEVDVGCVFQFGEGKTFQIRHDFRRLDGLLAAEMTSTNGFLKLDERRLLADPAERLRALATDPAVLGIA